MNKRTIALASLGVGAGIMYLVDLEEGRRRRARLRDAAVHVSKILKAAARMTSRDVGHRLTGMAARMFGAIAADAPPDDDVLVARVRARLGRLVSHPGAIDVTASNGIVTVSGPIFDAEVEQLLKGVGAVAGVTGIENRLDGHRHAEHVPALQGAGPLEIPRVAGWRRRTPAGRLAAGAVGVALVALSSRYRTRGGATARPAGRCRTFLR